MLRCDFNAMTVIMNSSSSGFAKTSGLTRRTCLGLALLWGSVRSAGAAPITLPSAKSLRDELALALKGGHPLVVMVSLDGCPYCKVVRENYLSPLHQEQGLPVVQVDMQSGAAVQDFHGMVFTHDALVHAWNVTLAPTVLFFGRDGAEVAPRLKGIGSADYYGAFLDARLEQARAAIKAP